MGYLRDIIFGTVYISPIKSEIYKNESITEDTFTTLTKHIASFDKEDMILVGGDFNARTGRLLDFIEDENEGNEFFTQPNLILKDIVKRKRINQDKIVNQFGEELRDLCISTNMKILNGRTLGDFIGQPTYIGPRGCSTVDYVISTENAITGRKEILQKFQIEDLNRFSDHRPLSLYINCNNNSLNFEKDSGMLQKCGKRKTPNLQHDLEKTLNSKETKAKLTEITKIVKNINENNAVDYTLKEIEKLLTNDSRSIQNEALQSNENVQPNKKIKKPRSKRKEPWYNLECKR